MTDLEIAEWRAARVTNTHPPIYTTVDLLGSLNHGDPNGVADVPVPKGAQVWLGAADDAGGYRAYARQPGVTDAYVPVLLKAVPPTALTVLQGA